MISGQQQNRSYHFVFHGQVWSYFVICLVNVILSVITLGIFIPWAWVRSRRYLCENMEFNGARFGYHGRGITILLSWVLIFVMLVLLSLALAIFYPGSEGIGGILFLMLLPVMITKGLSYHASMTSLDKIRFGFQCHPLRAWWVMLGMPVLIYVLMVVVFSMVARYLSFYYGANGINSMVLGIIFLALLTLLITGITNGVVYSHWLKLVGKGTTFGANKFNINISTKRCVIIFLLATVILLPFILLFIVFSVSVFSQMIVGCMFGLCTESTALLMALQHLGVVMGGFLFLAMGIVLSTTYTWAALRNHALNNLVLGDSVHFRSTLTFYGLAPRLLGLAFLPLLTLGLAYPWLKIHLIRYITENTAVVGELDSLDLEAAVAPQPATSDKLCSGFFPMLPFL
jgi:uncharacterized membrane protein YjgN (DUF898 family)